MRRSATDNDLLYYEKYLNLKERFNNEYTKNDRINPDELLNDTEFNISNKIILRPVFVELLRHIRNNGVFMFDESQACSYVSYILSKDAKKYVGDYKPETFDIFKKFVNKYSKESKHKVNICSSSLLYVDDKMYDQMHNLYVLYDEYKKLIKENHLGEPSSCLAANFFLSQYNVFIKKYQPTNIPYKKILDHFAKEIQRSIYSYNLNACPTRKFHIEKIELEILPKEIRPEASFQEEQPPNHSEYQVFPAKSPPTEAELQAPREEHGTVNAKPQATHLESQTAQEHPQTLHEVNNSSQETSEFGTHHAVQVQQHQQQRLPREEIHQRESHGDPSLVHPTRYRPLDSSETASYSERYPYSSVQTLSNKVELPQSSFMNTITSTLKNIDPYPVVGVSGGMGALFLLFRYTPVGTFFRGRGYRQRIPTRFDGVYPGFFPGLEGFEEGGYFPNNQINIAYGRE